MTSIESLYSPELRAFASLGLVGSVFYGPCSNIYRMALAILSPDQHTVM